MTKQVTQIVLYLIQAVLALSLLVSSAAHLLNPYLFLSSVSAYQFLPPEATIWFSAILPFVQLLTGAALLLSVMVPGASLLAGSLFLSFLVAQISAVLNAREISCGCFGYWSTEIGWQSMALAAALFLGSVCLFLFNSTRRSK